MGERQCDYATACLAKGSGQSGNQVLGREPEGVVCWSLVWSLGLNYCCVAMWCCSRTPLGCEMAMLEAWRLQRGIAVPQEWQQRYSWSDADQESQAIIGAMMDWFSPSKESCLAARCARCRCL